MTYFPGGRLGNMLSAYLNLLWMKLDFGYDTYFPKSDFEVSGHYTMWKFQYFSATQILREIKFEDSISAKSAILAHFEALNFDFYYFLQFWKAEIKQYQSLNPLKIAVFETSRIPKLDFT